VVIVVDNQGCPAPCGCDSDRMRESFDGLPACCQTANAFDGIDYLGACKQPCQPGGEPGNVAISRSEAVPRPLVPRLLYPFPGERRLAVAGGRAEEK
jgi:hypothetical protein